MLMDYDHQKLAKRKETIFKINFLHSQGAKNRYGNLLFHKILVIMISNRRNFSELIFLFFEHFDTFVAFSKVRTNFVA